MMTDEPTADTMVAERYDFYAIVAHATSDMVRRSEFGVGDNE
jgi:hypothetical protein